jgi:hypothetical protein
MLRRLILCTLVSAAFLAGSVGPAMAEEPVHVWETRTVTTPGFNFTCWDLGYAFDVLSTFTVTRHSVLFYEGSTLVKEIRYINFSGTSYRSDDLSKTIPHGGIWTRTVYPLENIAVHTGLFRYSHADGSGMMFLDAGRTVLDATPPFTAYSDTGQPFIGWRSGVCEYLAVA